MTLPFDENQFFAVFRQYNEAVWPFQIVFFLLGCAAFALAATRTGGAGRAIAAILAALWAWMGAVYHLGFFLPINPAAGFFGALFLTGAALFAWEGVVLGRLRFGLPRTLNARAVLALGLGAYALILYPLLARAAGRGVEEVASLGLPCPTTILTIAILGLARPPVPRAVFIVPFLWALIGMQAAWLLGVYEDLGLLIAAVAGAWFAFARHPEREPA